MGEAIAVDDDGNIYMGMNGTKGSSAMPGANPHRQRRLDLHLLK